MDENRADLSKARDGIDVAEESAGKRFKVEWDFHEEKIKKFVNLGGKQIFTRHIFVYPIVFSRTLVYLWKMYYINYLQFNIRTKGYALNVAQWIKFLKTD